MEPRATRRERAGRIAAILADWHAGSTGTPLAWTRPLDLLVATILAAQSRDDTVNAVMPGLLDRFPDARALAGAPIDEIETLVHRTGFFRAKARSVQECCRRLVERHGGEVPRTMDDLVALPGVGRKTANVVLGNCFGLPAMVVDTHVLRLSRRWDLAESDDADRVEADLCALLPDDQWTPFSHRVTWFGRSWCTARAPRCDGCRLRGPCPFPGSPSAGAGSDARRPVARPLSRARGSR